MSGESGDSQRPMTNSMTSSLRVKENEEENKDVFDNDSVDWQEIRRKYDKFRSDEEMHTAASEISSSQIYGRKIITAIVGIVSFILLISLLVLNKLSIMAVISLTQEKEIISRESLGFPTEYEIESHHFEGYYNYSSLNGTNDVDVKLYFKKLHGKKVSWLPVDAAFLGRVHVLFLLLIPTAVTLLVNVLSVLFGKRSLPSFNEFLFFSFMEVCHTVGSCLLFFNVLPEIGLVLSPFLFCASGLFVPSLLDMILSSKKSETISSIYPTVTFSLVILCMVVGSVVQTDHFDLGFAVTSFVALTLSSLGYWESFAATDQISGPKTHKNPLSKLSEYLCLLSKEIIIQNTRNYNLIFSSIIKIIFIFIFFSINETVKKNSNFLYQGDYFMNSGIYFISFDTTTLKIVSSNQATFTWWAGILSSFLCTVFSYSTCQMNLHFTYSLSLIISTPITLLFLLFLKQTSTSMGEIRFYLSNIDFNLKIISYFLISFWFLQILLCSKSLFTLLKRFSESERIFVFPKLCIYSETIEQFLLFTKRKDLIFYDRALAQEVSLSQSFNPLAIKKPIIFCCATMWHENAEEMKSLVLSLLRLDEEKNVSVNNQFQNDLYDIECHIFFDDAFKTTIKKHKKIVVPNQYVETLISVVASIKKWHKKEMKSPCKIKTPYGAKIRWKMPNGTDLHVHLKDRELIRHRKRWSQIMYIQYLLTYRIQEMIKDMSEKVYKNVLKNVYILSLDGDVDFQPEAVRHLYFTMMTNKKIGSVCGVIKPLGSGLLYWYQRFEYAVAHWLQKSAEHSLGSVLCSPGCFSLFRASALADDNVAETYSKLAEKPEQRIQYDQGEDRWLCTLLIQRGYSVAYNSNSISYTNAPENFHEFYNQRRRWGPSTIANVIDLLSSASKTVMKNDNISWFYIIYQAFLLIISLIGPATLLLVLTENFTFVVQKVNEKSISSKTPKLNICDKNESKIDTAEIVTLAIVITATGVYVMLCKFLPSRIQINVAFVFTIISAFVMLMVFIGILITIAEKIFASLQTLIIILFSGILFISAILHLAIFDFFCGLIYVLLIPSMYLFLAIYGFSNLNNISWGTREETKSTKSEKVPTSFTEALEQQLSGFFHAVQNLIRSCCLTCFPCMFSEPKILSEINYNLTQLAEKQKENNTSVLIIQPETIENSDREIIESVEKMESCLNETHETIEYFENLEDWKDRSWLTLENALELDFQANIEEMNEEEIRFFRWLIHHKLYPLNESLKTIDQKKQQLAELRDKVCFAVYLLNGLWMLALAVVQGSAVAKYCLPVPANYVGFHGGIEFDFINLVMLILYGSLVIIQFLSMLHMRWLALKELVFITNTYEWSNILKALKNLNNTQLGKQKFQVQYLSDPPIPHLTIHPISQNLSIKPIIDMPE